MNTVSKFLKFLKHLMDSICPLDKNSFFKLLQKEVYILGLNFQLISYISVVICLYYMLTMSVSF